MNRRIGIRVKRFEAPVAYSALGAVEVYDVETGDLFEGIHAVELVYDVNGAVRAKFEIYVAAVEMMAEKNE